jgi:tRNA (guanine37-N1)-methyltransferase
MNINIITLFPEIFKSLQFGLLGQAIDQKKIHINIFDLRKNAINSYGQVDDKPYGGGEGMVLMAEPLERTINSISNIQKGHVINMSPQGNNFSQSKAKELAKKNNITIIAGRYEGIDQRFINQYVDEEISTGDYILSGGEFAALILIDACSRFIPGVIGNKKSVDLDTFSNGLLKGPVFTRPEKFNNSQVPDVLLSGDHERIKQWKENNALKRTFERRPELLNDIKLTKKQKKLLEEWVSRDIL